VKKTGDRRTIWGKISGLLWLKEEIEQRQGTPLRAGNLATYAARHLTDAVTKTLQ